MMVLILNSFVKLLEKYLEYYEFHEISGKCYSWWNKLIICLRYVLFEMFQEVYHIPGTSHCIVTKDFKNKTLGDMMESSNTKIPFGVSF